MVKPVEPDRYADTGYSVKDTSPEINALIFKKMMSLTERERFKIGMSMTATAMAMVWSTIPEDLSQEERRDAFLIRFYGQTLEEIIGPHPVHKRATPIDG